MFDPTCLQFLAYLAAFGGGVLGLGVVLERLARNL